MLSCPTIKTMSMVTIVYLNVGVILDIAKNKKERVIENIVMLRLLTEDLLLDL